MRTIQVQAKAIKKFLKEERPDVIIFSVVGALSSLLLYHIAKKEGIRTLVIQRSRIGTKFSLTEDYNDAGYIGKSFDEIQKNNESYQDLVQLAKKFLNDFHNKPSPYSVAVTPKGRPTNRKKQFAFLLPGGMLESAGWFLKILYKYLTSKHRDDYSVDKKYDRVHFDIPKNTYVFLFSFDGFSFADRKNPLAY